MPEGPEVKLSADLVRPMVVGKTIMLVCTTANSRYATTNPAGYIDFRGDLYKGCQVADIRTKGKFTYWVFSNDWYLLNTFGMTGQWSPVLGKHSCFCFHFKDNSEMVFNDPRHFGTIKFTNDRQQLNKKLKELGWDPLGADDGASYLNAFRKVAALSKPIGQLLMDQKLFAGVGNYIRAEALYVAGISPWRPGNAILPDKLVQLFDALKQVMQESYQHQGATIHTYKTVYGEEGKYSSCFKVYDQKQDPLGNPIIKETTPEGRTIHWCPNMQK